jgi:hypothetical protein
MLFKNSYWEVGEIGKAFFPKTLEFRPGQWGVPLDIALGFYAAERIPTDALPKCGFLPIIQFSKSTYHIEDFNPKSIKIKVNGLGLIEILSERQKGNRKDVQD